MSFFLLGCLFYFRFSVFTAYMHDLTMLCWLHSTPKCSGTKLPFDDMACCGTILIAFQGAYSNFHLPAVNIFWSWIFGLLAACFYRCCCCCCQTEPKRWIERKTIFTTILSDSQQQTPCDKMKRIGGKAKHSNRENILSLNILHAK